MRRAVLTGLAFGAGAVHLAAVGVLLAMHQRWIIVDALTLGQAALLLLAGGAGAMAQRPVLAVVAGAASGVPLAALLAVMSLVPLNSIFIALSHDLFDMLTLGIGLAAGVTVLIGGGAIAGLINETRVCACRGCQRRLVLKQSPVEDGLRARPCL